jgi:hypothetical protein
MSRFITDLANMIDTFDLLEMFAFASLGDILEMFARRQTGRVTVESLEHEDGSGNSILLMGWVRRQSGKTYHLTVWVRFYQEDGLHSRGLAKILTPAGDVKMEYTWGEQQ